MKLTSAIPVSVMLLIPTWQACGWRCAHHNPILRSQQDVSFCSTLSGWVWWQYIVNRLRCYLFIKQAIYLSLSTQDLETQLTFTRLDTFKLHKRYLQYRNLIKTRPLIEGSKTERLWLNCAQGSKLKKWLNIITEKTKLFDVQCTARAAEVTENHRTLGAQTTDHNMWLAVNRTEQNYCGIKKLCHT